MSKVYFLYKQYIDHFVVYAQGLPVTNISNLSEFRIIRMYPSPMKDLTPKLVQLQKRWRERKCYRRWCAHPHQLRYREMYGKYPNI